MQGFIASGRGGGHNGFCRVYVFHSVAFFG